LAQNITQKVISEHLVEGEMESGSEIGIKIDQTLTQDATGTMAYLQFEAIGIPEVKTELSASYIDHNLLQTDFKNADDHRYLQSVGARFGVYLSRPGNGVSHQVHLERFGVPGKTLLGSDSHTPTNGALGMIAIGAGGLDVAMAMAGQPFYLKMPKVVGVKLTGKLGPWVSAKDVILEVLRRLSVKGGVGKVMEYFGPGVETLDVPSRATICNMGAELGATTSIFPSDGNTKKFLESQDRAKGWREIKADSPTAFDEVLHLDLGEIEPMIACPTSPDNVVKVRDVVGKEVSQVIVGSSCNSSFRDLMIVSLAIKDKHAHPSISFEINPGSRQVLENVASQNGVLSLLQAGARIHQSGCLGCIGMGQAPATKTISLRTFPRNFPGRSGTLNDQVYLCSPETAVAAAIKGRITDPRDLGVYPEVRLPEKFLIDDSEILPPTRDGKKTSIIRGPNIQPLPEMTPLPQELEGEVLIKVDDNVSTDEVMPAGAEILPLRSNIQAISEYVFSRIDPTFSERTKKAGGGFVVGGENYGQGSSREHAALAPRYLGIKGVLAKSFARIHKSNLLNFGILPLEFLKSDDYEKVNRGSTVSITNVKSLVERGATKIPVKIDGWETQMNLNITDRERRIVSEGGLMNYVRAANAKKS
jgi:aconitate hydratase